MRYDFVDHDLMGLFLDKLFGKLSSMIAFFLASLHLLPN